MDNNSECETDALIITDKREYNKAGYKSLDPREARTQMQNCIAIHVGIQIVECFK